MSEHDQIEEHDRGLSFDLPQLIGRRAALVALVGAGAAALAACGSGSGDAAAADEEELIPAETSGPYPGDGSNGPNVLAQSGIVRRDIRSSFAGAAGSAAGVPLTITLKVLDVSGADGAPYAGAAVYLWHCDREGRYSMYSPGVTGENYLRGVQAAGSDGTVTFTSVFPGCYRGRWPHIHFEVYPSETAATSAEALLRTSQLALPEPVCADVYAAEGYSASIDTLAGVSLADDTVFRDGYSLQLATVTGSVAKGYTATLTVPV